MEDKNKISEETLSSFSFSSSSFSSSNEEIISLKDEKTGKEILINRKREKILNLEKNNWWKNRRI